MISLSFNATQFHPIQQNDDQIWITSSELARALGYAREDSVSRIYDRNSDEFTSDMTTTVKLTVVRATGSVKMDNRIFSLRGCHLITFFARTPVAKQFRKWVLDILDKEVQPTKTHKSERTPLNNAINMLVAKSKHLNYSEAYTMLHHRFNVEHIEDIPYEAIPVAVEYVHHLIALFSQADKNQTAVSDRSRSIALHALWLNHWWTEFGEAIRKISPVMGHGIHDHFKFAAEDARQIVGREVYMPIYELAQRHDWHKGGIGYKALSECRSLNTII
ncbi:BRO family protein [Acinetobacter indicus]|jgi:prophage antirepressor-like protein|uniref:BRO-N domain-containing protein n=1 Tax=Acinetobacter indicus TaxID=756892 RepID=UPI0032145528